MFFSAELLSRRDSGFGLLWLAATLGAKSSFKKLPKRDVLTADIAGLCKAIKDPLEPLALRLSSNLMVGVVRVYRVKQELLMADVQACSALLKRAVQELTTSASVSLVQLQMAQSTTRPELLTLRADPGASFAIEFDELIADWDDIVLKGAELRDDDSEYGVRPRRARRQTSGSVSLAEQGRAQHTLNDPNDFLLSNSLDSSFPELGGSMGPMSSQLEGARLGVDDRLLDPADELGLGGLEDLQRELGWEDPAGPNMSGGFLPNPIDPALDPVFDLAMPDLEAQEALTHDIRSTSSHSLQGAALRASPQPGLRELSSPSVEANSVPSKKEPSGRKAKKDKVVLDTATELTSDELKEARAHYLERQTAARRETEGKRRERANMEMVEQVVWGAPSTFVSPVLAQLWTDNVGPRMKRKRVDVSRAREPVKPPLNMEPARNEEEGGFVDHPMTPPFEPEVDATMEPLEQPRFGSRRLSEARGWQPGASPAPGQGSGVWNPFLSRSSIGPEFPGGDGSIHGSMGVGDTNLGRHSRSSSRGENFAPLGALPSGGDTSFAIDSGNLSTQALAQDFAFALPGPAVHESQQSDANAADLERTSLDYAKEQLRSLPDAGSVVFEDIVPPEQSTKHVAASVFYHCLVLATKDLIKVQQDVAHGPISIMKV